MNKRILSRAEESRIDLKKSITRSAELLSKSKQFAIEQMSTGLKTMTGYMRRFVLARRASGFFILGKDSTAAAIALVTSITNPADTQSSFNTIASKGLLGLAFAETVHITKNAYDALHSLDVITEFNKQQELIDLAYDPNFKGELPAELHAFKEGTHCGPLTCEFEAHAKLAEQGIQYIHEGKQGAFIFPEKMVSDIRQQFDSATNAHQHDASCHVLVFKECAHPHYREHTPQSSPYKKDMAPRLIPIPKGEALTYVPQ